MTTIKVEVAYALPDKQAIVEVEVAVGTTAAEAVRQSTITTVFDNIDIENAKLGIFGKGVADTLELKAGDRVEIYRPLVADPKEIRKARAAKAKERRSSGSE
ncbi:MAG: putative ubiquitin-RnfH superfamily antitoxin RatB of RatAB toxin-antitoxin module [Halioglobus sp.]|jgi:putative ubiquitin-RnfH superfamily antitoxin RatB of RatAB toxin-antitoxin module